MAEPLILVVDDDQGILDLMVRRLDRRGLRSDSAMDGPVARQMILDRAYDLVLTDIYMPGGLTGLDLLRIARERDPHVQVIVVTAAAALDNAVDALNEGAFSYLIKPFDHLSVFDNAVTRALDYRRLIQDNLRMAEAQRRRGDMLEAEVTERIQLMRRKQQDVSELLDRLPVGIVVVDAEGRTLLSNDAADDWAKLTDPQGRRPLEEHLANLIPPTFPTPSDVAVGAITLRVLAQPLPPLQGKIRTLVVVQEREKETSGGMGAGEILGRLKAPIDWLCERPLDPEEASVVRALQTQLLALDRLSGGDEQAAAAAGKADGSLEDWPDDARRSIPRPIPAAPVSSQGSAPASPPPESAADRAAAPSSGSPEQPIVLTSSGLQRRGKPPAGSAARPASGEPPAGEAGAGDTPLPPTRLGMLKRGLTKRFGATQTDEEDQDG